MRSLAYALVMIVALVLDFLSDLLIRPDAPSVAEGWDVTATIIIVLGIVGLVQEDRRAHASASIESESEPLTLVSGK